MALITSSPVNATTGFGTMIAELTSRFAAWNTARITRRELSQLSQRELRDLGINRGDFDTIAAGIRPRN